MEKTQAQKDRELLKAEKQGYGVETYKKGNTALIQSNTLTAPISITRRWPRCSEGTRIR